MPEEIIKLHNNIFLGIDIMCVNGMGFLITVSSKIKFITIEQMNNKNIKTIKNCVKSVIKLYNERNLTVATVAGDDEFDPLKQESQEKYNINYNPTAADEHVAEVERMICIVKERIRATTSRFPWKAAISRLMMCEVVKKSVMMTNSFPPQSGIHATLSPRNVVTGQTLNYDTHFKVPFGRNN